MAYSLKNISTYSLINLAREKSTFDLVYKEIYEWLLCYGITDFQKLDDMFSSNPPSDLACRELSIYLNKVRSGLRSKSDLSNIPIFSFDVYETLGGKIDLPTAFMTDEATSASKLIFLNPTRSNITGIRSGNVEDDVSVKDLKHLSSHLMMPNSCNGLKMLGFKSSMLQRCVSSIKFYEEQVVRQLLETGITGRSVFDINFSERYKIASEQLPNIIDFIISLDSTETVWGGLTSNQKILLQQISCSFANCVNRQQQKELLKLHIAYYATLGELEGGICGVQKIPCVVDAGIEYREEEPAKRFARSLIR